MVEKMWKMKLKDREEGGRRLQKIVEEGGDWNGEKKVKKVFGGGRRRVISICRIEWENVKKMKLKIIFFFF